MDASNLNLENLADGFADQMTLADSVGIKIARVQNFYTIWRVGVKVLYVCALFIP